MEEYFKILEFEYVFVDFIGYNYLTLKFYSKQGHPPIMLTAIEKL